MWSVKAFGNKKVAKNYNISLVLFFTIIILFSSTCIFGQVNPNYHYVEGYYKKDGTHVPGHYKTNPNYTNRDNYTTKPNINPWTNKPGYIEPDQNFLNIYEENGISNKLAGLFESAYELHREKKYQESLDLCNEIVLEQEESYTYLELIGWNFIGLGNYQSALNAFKTKTLIDGNTPQNLSLLYITYKLNNYENDAMQILQGASVNYNLNKEFQENLREQIRRVHINYILKNPSFLNLILNDKDIYIGSHWLSVFGNCMNCKVENVTKRTLDIGNELNTMRVHFDEEWGSIIMGLEFLYPKSEFTLLKNILMNLGYKHIGDTTLDTFVRESKNLTGTVPASIYRKSEHQGIILFAVDLDGNEYSKYFKVLIRKG